MVLVVTSLASLGTGRSAHNTDMSASCRYRHVSKLQIQPCQQAADTAMLASCRYRHHSRKNKLSCQLTQQTPPGQKASDTDKSARFRHCHSSRPPTHIIVITTGYKNRRVIRLQTQPSQQASNTAESRSFICSQVIRH